ncbi:MAG: replication associated protein [Microviridae sp. ctjWc39]|nr:MAG: replication associated protein [Microviridae sp. ctjWc39]QGH72364.1 MAG: replication associated protein [Microviridae sp. ctGWf34]
MPCYHPLQAYYSVRSDGKKDLHFSSELTKFASRSFHEGKKLPASLAGSFLSLPCGRCMGCRLERSRQWAVRIMHEAQLYEDNCFITLTFDEDNLKKMCPNGSLDRKHMQNFLKRLRQKFGDRKIRTFYCGEYGDDLGRPHYHACLFNLDFTDKLFWKSVNGCRYYTSKSLRDVWTFGHSVVGDLTFDSAAYVARYCTKKVTGDKALIEDHYKGRLPEFCQASLKPGIGSGWLDRFGASDVFPLDEVVVRGVRCKPPRYYDKRLERDDPIAFEKLKLLRLERAKDKEDDNTHARLLVKEKCQQARFKKLIRTLERS